MPGLITIATNMAGRGTDIILGGNPKGLAQLALENTVLPAMVPGGPTLFILPFTGMLNKSCCNRNVLVPLLATDPEHLSGVVGQLVQEGSPDEPRTANAMLTIPQCHRPEDH